MNRALVSLEALDEPSPYIGLCIVLLSCILYIPFLTVPFLPDDYLQVTLARNFGPVTKWPLLFEDPLFRDRATSIVMTYWTDRLFPLSQLACGVSSILLHAINGLLVYGLGMARCIGWRLSALAAIVFVMQERHHEAIIWYAAQPELLAFFFVLITLLLWIRWLHDNVASLKVWTAMLMTFVLALLSKESAVAAVPLMLLLSLSEKVPIRRAISGLSPFVVVGLGYAIWVFHGQSQNHHSHDGTFNVQMGFLKTAALSTGRGLWVWGWVALIFLVASRVRSRWLLGASLLGMFAALLPYSFLTYMSTVPSRHHYLAAVGCSLIVAMGMLQLLERTLQPRCMVTRDCCPPQRLFVDGKIPPIREKSTTDRSVSAFPG